MSERLYGTMSHHDVFFSQIKTDLDEIEQAVQTNTQFMAALETIGKDSSAYRGIVGGIAMNLQTACAELERILTAIAKHIDAATLEGSQEHRNLLAMTKSTENRPTILRIHTLSDLQQLLSFRQVILNDYSYALSDEEVLENADRLSSCFANFAYDCLVLQCTLTNSVATSSSLPPAPA